MTLDKFGRSLKSTQKSQKGPKGDGFLLTPEGNYDMQNKTVCNLADPTNEQDALNLRAAKRICLSKEGSNFNANGSQIINLIEPKNPTDSATKIYVDNTCTKEHLALTTNLATQLLSITDLNTRMAKCEGRIETDKIYHDKNLKKFGVYLFNYINKKQTGRSVTLPTAGEGDYLNWDVLFKLPVNEEDEADEEVPIDESEIGLLMTSEEAGIMFPPN